MHGSPDELSLDPIPASVGRARGMVAARLRDLGREELIDSAELVVSELVTNALLHAGAPITVRVRGTRRHPRVEVGDRSMLLPRLPESLAAAARPAVVSTAEADHADLDLEALTTGGRGIGLVIIHSTSWGVDRASDSKVVWFEPAPEPRSDARNEIQVFESEGPAFGSLDDPADERSVPTSADLYRVRLLGTPVRTIASLRRHYDELQREIRLIGLQYGGRASSLPRQFFIQAAHPERHRLRAVGAEQVAAALERGEEYADLDYLVAREDAEEFAETIDLLVSADAFCRREQLLTLALTQRQLSTAAWFLDQILSQIEGAAPEPWREPALARG